MEIPEERLTLFDCIDRDWKRSTSDRPHPSLSHESADIFLDISSCVGRNKTIKVPVIEFCDGDAELGWPSSKHSLNGC